MPLLVNGNGIRGRQNTLELLLLENNQVQGGSGPLFCIWLHDDYFSINTVMFYSFVLLIDSLVHVFDMDKLPF